ncbi:MAG: class I SAM-dependent methyltransferase [Acidimicrobiales bacterium]
MNGAIAADGSPIEVFARFPAGQAPAYVTSRLDAGSSILDLGCGAGRLAKVFSAAGHHVVGVDQSPEMLAAVDDAGVETVVADIETVDLGRRFDAVVLASYLVNDPSEERRLQYLRACRRHVREGGTVFIQRHDPSFLTGPVPVASAEDGFGFTFDRLTEDGPLIRARVTYLHEDRTWEQEFDTMIIDDEQMTAMLDAAGLALRGWLDEFGTWAEAGPT